MMLNYLSLNRIIIQVISQSRRFFRAGQFPRSHHGPNHHRYGRSGHSHHSSPSLFFIPGALTVIGGGVVLIASNYHNCTICDTEIDQRTGVSFETGQSFTNWSNTKSCEPNKVYEPLNSAEVSRVLRMAHDSFQKIRPIGTALSPNGIGMSNSNLISLSHMDYVEVDTQRSLVTVGAGARVSDVLMQLSKHNLTLQNFSSIQEQQMGGWTQVAAHGTGCTLPTVDEMIVRMKLVTPIDGILTLSNDSNSDLFKMARVGLGTLGVVTELTLQCIPTLSLREHTYTTPQARVRTDHYEKLESYRHVRYMWLPFTEKVVVVVSNPEEKTTALDKKVIKLVNYSKSITKSVKATDAMRELLIEINSAKYNNQNTENLSFSQLRDLLLDHAPLETEHIKKVNLAESKYWEGVSNTRVGDSTNILGFDCGGEQHVFEVCFNMGTLSEKTFKDIEFVEKLLKIIGLNNLPAPSPVEQRWSAASSSPMSPVFSKNIEDVFSWVGIIMYLPPGQDAKSRYEIKKKYQEYVRLLQPLMEEYQAHCHWAKIELPPDDSKSDPYEHFDSENEIDKLSSKMNSSSSHSSISDESSFSALSSKSLRNMVSNLIGTTADGSVTYDTELKRMRSRIAKKYPVKQFNAYRKAIDPNNILSNELIDELFKE